MSEAGREKEAGSRLGEVTPIAGGLHQGPVGPKGRWSKKRKAEVVIRMLQGEPLDSLSREPGVEIWRLEEWRDKALASMEAGLARREGDPVQEQLDWAMKKIGELSMENGLLRKRCEAKESLRPRRPQEMSARTSPSTGRPYGVRRTCAAWGRKRSSFCARTCPGPDSPDDPTPERTKPGPKTELSDAELLSLIREDLDSSPFIGEGHRKVWARLRFAKGIPIKQPPSLELRYSQEIAADPRARSTNALRPLSQAAQGSSTGTYFHPRWCRGRAT